MVKVSIVIPVYNKESYLEQCLTSLQNQTYKEIEIVCVDDGSKDSSLQVLKQYAEKDHRIKVIAQDNSGTLIARKVGVGHSTGDYIMFLDPDDWFEVTACDDMLNCILKTKADIVLGGYVFEGNLHENGIDINYFDYYFNGCLTRYNNISKKDILRKALVSCEIPAPQSGKMFKMSIVKEAFKLIPSIRCIFAEDQGTAFFIFNKSSKIAFLNKKMYHYRIGSGISTQTRYSLQRFTDCLQSFDMLIAIKNYCAAQTEDKSFLEEIVTSMQTRMIQTALQFTHRLEENVKTEDWQQILLNKCGLDLIIEEILSMSTSSSTLTLMINKNRKYLRHIRILLIVCAMLFVSSVVLLFILFNSNT